MIHHLILSLAGIAGATGAEIAASQPTLTAEAVVEAQAAVERLSWLSGSWEERDEQPEGAPPTWTEEVWTSPRGGTLLGIGRRGVAHRLGMYEFLRIQAGADGVLAYVVQAEPGDPAVSFPLVRSGPQEAVFENPQHDYPQRIAYRRAGNELTATISRVDGSGERSWTFQLRGALP